MEFYTKFNPPPAPVLDFKDEPKLVAEEFAKEADINFLLARFKNTGSFYSVDEMARATRRPQFGDFTGIPDYQASLDKMNKALEMFAELPLKVRQRFHDSPIELLAFMQDEKNLDEAIELGIVEKKSVEKPAASKPASQAAPAAVAPTEGE